MLGPAAYDLVSLLQDARIDVPEQLELTLLTRYIKARRAADRLLSMRRPSPSSMQSCRRSETRGCSAPLRGSTAATASRIICKHQPRIWTYLNRSLAHPTLTPFREWYCGQRATAGGNLFNYLLAARALNPALEPCLRARGVGVLDKRTCHGEAERREGERVVFERGFPAHMMGIDGTWRRSCIMEDISETGAKLTVDGSVEGLNLKNSSCCSRPPDLPIAAANWAGSMATRLV